NRELLEARADNNGLDDAGQRLHREVEGVSVREASARPVKPDKAIARGEWRENMREERLPIQFDVTKRWGRDEQEVAPLAFDAVSNADSIARSRVLDFRCGHHSGPRPPHTRTDSRTPLRARSPRAS